MEDWQRRQAPLDKWPNPNSIRNSKNSEQPRGEPKRKSIPSPAMESYSANEEGLSFQEERAFESGNYDLQKQSERNHHHRSEEIKSHFNRAAIIMIWVFFGILVIFAGVLALHMVLPEQCHWLTKDQFYALQSVTLTGSMATMIGNHLRSHLDSQKRN